MKLTPELIASFSPYRTSHLNRFRLFELKERSPLPVDHGIVFGISPDVGHGRGNPYACLSTSKNPAPCKLSADGAL